MRGTINTAASEFDKERRACYVIMYDSKAISGLYTAKPRFLWGNLTEIPLWKLCHAGTQSLLQFDNETLWFSSVPSYGETNVHLTGLHDVKWCLCSQVQHEDNK